MSEPVEAVLIGAGNRGADVYGRWIAEHPARIRLVGVAEPRAERREAVARAHGLSEDRCFADWPELLGAVRARAALVCTRDPDHTAPAVAAMEAGCDLLLEKPMATTAAECARLAAAAARTGRLVLVAHVLRYTPLFRAIREGLRAGRIGEVVAVEHRENVSWWHMAHSYVRGHWRRRDEAAPLLLAKSCHDLDLLHWLLDRPCERLTSVGSLLHFRPEHAPAGAPPRCTDGCPAAAECPWDAVATYVELRPMLRELAEEGPLGVRASALAALAPGGMEALERAARYLPPLRRITGYHGWPRSVLTDRPGREALLAALREGPWGRCVYRCDNDVVDRQVVLMEFAGGVPATLTVQGHSHREGRTLRWDGTRGTLRARLNLFGSELEWTDHRGGGREVRRWEHPLGSAHGGGDAALMEDFVSALERGGGAGSAGSEAGDALVSHLLAFAADEARLGGDWVDFSAFRARLRPD